MMNDLDKIIKDALKGTTDSIGITDDPSMIEGFISTFQGQHKAILILAAIKLIPIAIMMVGSVYLFFQQESTMALIAYASLAIICMVGLMTIYLFLWISLNNNTLHRDVKRLELQIALLLQKLETG